ncbi:DUF2561 family protein [Candidatus Mycobacterium methanotrophicum]|uniref:DUF2561 family protein n=1 Tax=Candidatus Mycobacterium methanotrophicum TaxID=2943498 RepID=A0ABY4QHR5_9MYCO|nr:DUF2561 family protein [Candidatus Mycobacterium methanotrophicum]UQX09495.1 DUF2561 family protein [Candidatus Mycobacterium methanotrophicum]
MADRYPAGWGPWSRVAPVTGDRILVGVCAAVWLALVGMSVAATVALMDLGRGFHDAKGNPHSSSVLYAIIVISALVILAAIPMLLRARRVTRDGPVARSAGTPTRTVSGQPIRSGTAPTRTITPPGRTERLTPLRAALPEATVDRIWLRGTAALMGTMGAALLAVAAATYLMAIGHEAFSWTSYGIAGVVTLVMPLVPWRQVRQLRRTLAG